ncbi:hypothetical protein [Radiobacillus sp. PE A8.2]|uniref:hypothetical protein n=1 Tax=Radiobacillus sp. PE A8.2 TaxID=3380349 RepID=UPI0038902D7F
MNQPITSFIVRFHKVESNDDLENNYRIKITHVQRDREISFDTFEEAMKYMKQEVDDTDD